MGLKRRTISYFLWLFPYHIKLLTLLDTEFKWNIQYFSIVKIYILILATVKWLYPPVKYLKTLQKK